MCFANIAVIDLYSLQLCKPMEFHALRNFYNNIWTLWNFLFDCYYFKSWSYWNWNVTFGLANSLNLTLWMLRKTCLGGALIELRIVSNKSILNLSKQIGFELTSYFWLLHLMSSKWCLVSSFSLYLHHFQFFIQCCYLHNEKLKIYNICSGTDPGACKVRGLPNFSKF